MLVIALQEEVNGFLKRARYQRGKEFRDYRNGYHPAREETWAGQGTGTPGGKGAFSCGGAGVPVTDNEALPAGIRDHEEIICPALPGRTDHWGLRAGIPGAYRRDDGSVTQHHRPTEGELGTGISSLAEAAAVESSVSLRLG